ncbi:hypothetical protein JOQ06_013501, partial [Pogonophryne albipinna]
MSIVFVYSSPGEGTEVQRQRERVHAELPLPSYFWYLTGRSSINAQTKEGISYVNNFAYKDSFACAVRGLQSFASRPVYGPKLPSVSVSPSAEIEEGSSVTLTCSSDANPAANYTWYKENEDSPKASGQIFTITDFRAEHSGSYSCGAQNKLGRQNATICLTLAPDKPIIIIIIVVIIVTLLALILIAVLLLCCCR